MATFLTQLLSPLLRPARCGTWLLAGLFVLAGVAQAGDLNGTWRGSYLCGKVKTNLVLTITQTPPGDLQTEFAFQVTAGPHRNKQGRFLMQGDYRDADGTFRLKPTESIDMPRGFVPTPLSGTLAHDGTRLSGRVEVQGCSSFEVTRDTSAQGARVDMIPASGAVVRPEAPVVDSQTDFCGRIMAWSDRAEQEHPELGGGVARVDAISEIIKPLYADAHFIPVFGASLTALDSKQRKTIAQRMHKCFVAPQYRDRFNGWRRQSIDRPLLVARQALDDFVVMARANQVWRDQAWQALGQAAGTDRAAYLRALDFGRRLSSHDGDMWPSERVALMEKVAEERRRSAESQLVHVVDDLIERKASMDTLHAITRALNERELLGDNVVAVAQRETLRLQQRMDAILTDYMAQEEARLRGRGQGVEALEQGLKWHGEVQSRYRSFLDRAPVVELMARFAAQREGDLQAAHDELVQRFSQATQASALDADSRNYLDSRIDGESPQARRLLAALDRRKQEIKIEDERSRYSPRERELMVVAGELPLRVPDTYSEPDAGEIHLAVMRELADLGGRLLSGTVAEVGMPPFDRFLFVRVELKVLDKQSCQPSNAREYACTYRHGLVFSIPEGSYAFLRMGGRSELFEQMVNDYIKALNSAEPAATTQTFRLTSAGWRSPSIRDKGVKAIMDTYVEMAASLPDCTLMDWGGGKFTCE